jgi:RHS repeat-associated protein
MAQKQLFVLPSDGSSVIDFPDLEMAGIVNRRQRLRIRSGRWDVQRGRPLLAKGLVRPFIVVLVNEPVESRLLAFECGLGRPRGLRFERAMHPLVCAILFGMSWHDPFDVDPKTNPPERKPGKPRQSWRSERAAIVRQDGPRETVLAEYTYDGTGMVTRALVGTDDRSFAYTAGGERIAVRNGASWTWTVRDQGGKVLREFTSLETASSPSPLALSTATWKKDYVWRDGQLLATISVPAGGFTPTTYHYHLDHLGTPRMITADGGTVVSQHNYYPFGAEMNLTPQENPGEAMKFTGHERDIVVGDNHSVDYMHARYYNANLGRFLAVDSMLGKPGVPQSWNRYAYVLANPVNGTDPTGLCGEAARFIGPRQPCSYYVTTTFPQHGGDGLDARYSAYVRANAVNFEIDSGTATVKNFGTGLRDRTGVSVYVGHSNTVDSLLLTTDHKPAYVALAGFANRNSIACIAACNSTAILKNATLGPGQALIGVTSNQEHGYVRAGDLSYIGSQVIAGLKAGLTAGQIVDGLNEYYNDSERRGKDPNYRVKVTLRGDRDASAQ